MRLRLNLSQRFTVLIVAATAAFCVPAVWIQERSLYREKEATRHAVEVAYGVLDYMGIEQVRQTITQMEKVTQATAATAEESAAAWEELNALAEMTTRMVGDLDSLIGGTLLSAKRVIATAPPQPMHSYRNPLRSGA